MFCCSHSNSHGSKLWLIKSLHFLHLWLFVSLSTTLLPLFFQSLPSLRLSLHPIPHPFPHHWIQTNTLKCPSSSSLALPNPHWALCPERGNMNWARSPRQSPAATPAPWKEALMEERRKSRKIKKGRSGKVAERVAEWRSALRADEEIRGGIGETCGRGGETKGD